MEIKLRGKYVWIICVVEENLTAEGFVQPIKKASIETRSMDQGHAWWIV